MSNASILNEVRDRDRAIEKRQRQKRQKKAKVPQCLPKVPIPPVIEEQGEESSEASIEGEMEPVKKKPVPYVRVRDYEQMRREAGLL